MKHPVKFLFALENNQFHPYHLSDFSFHQGRLARVKFSRRANHKCRWTKSDSFVEHYATVKTRGIEIVCVYKGRTLDYLLLAIRQRSWHQFRSMNINRWLAQKITKIHNIWETSCASTAWHLRRSIIVLVLLHKWVVKAYLIFVLDFRIMSIARKRTQVPIQNPSKWCWIAHCLLHVTWIELVIIDNSSGVWGCNRPVANQIWQLG